MGPRALNKEQLLESLREHVDEPVISALSRVPREFFVPEALQSRAYDDTPLPIGLNQTISAP
ncbi:MAG: protein-L-isoaspartate O-methyltransferase, partial [Methanothrix sp.]